MLMFSEYEGRKIRVVKKTAHRDIFSWVLQETC